jgi:DNA-binding response OmpR family regulator
LVLVIEDDADIGALVQDVLQRGGLETIHANTGRDGMRQLFERRPDCVILDVGLPDLDGWTLLRRIREVGTLPVLMLTAQDREADKVRALSDGADDYLTKPFGTAELVARVHALLRRSRSPGTAIDSEVFDDGCLSLDPTTHVARLSGSELLLTPTEFALLSTLARAQPRVLPQSLLLELVWGDAMNVGPDRVKFVVYRLRQKLGVVSGCEDLIESIRGVGYRYRSLGDTPSKVRASIGNSQR